MSGFGGDLGATHLRVDTTAELGGSPLRYAEIGLRTALPPEPPIAPVVLQLILDLDSRLRALETRLQALEDARLSARLRRLWDTLLVRLGALRRWWEV